MTSNIGARFLQKRTPLGFSGTSQDQADSKAESEVLNEVKRVFNPEFLNRIDETIIFSSLGDEDLLKIIQLMVGQINENLGRKEIHIRVADDAAQYILEKTCPDRNYGARPLRRALQKYIEDPLSEALIQGALPRPAELEIFLGEDGMYYRSVKEGSEAEAEGEGGGVLAVSARTLLYSFV
jgi:ATP-dependent Clp protease ATP-binding subunit ClpC